MSDKDPDWWRKAVVYQVYPRSFADSDGDGIGDLAGVRSRLGYLSQLGIDAVWLSPFYPSPMADGGYDIADYRDVEPGLGTLADFDALVEQAHHLGLRVIVDIVPNHTSVLHPWFQEALQAGRGSAARDRYIFRDGEGPDGAEPPSDWLSHFGGSAWERTPDGQWYCHLFAPEQPDLNWGNSEVRTYFIDTLRFWADRGVDGFRIDVAHSLAKDLSEPLRSQPHLDTRLPADGTDPLYDREEVHLIYEEWRAVFDEYAPPLMAVGETWHPVSDRNFLYARPTELGQVFDFSMLKSHWDAEAFRHVIQRGVESHGKAGSSPTWVLSNHDVPRHASRLALPLDVDPDDWLITDGAQPRIDPAVGLRRARAASLMMLALPGSAYLYQGEELGLPEVADLPVDALHDPMWKRSGGQRKGRDGCRVPLPWKRSGPSLGFGDGAPWLPQPADFAEYSAEAQQDVETSTLSLYRAALHLRRVIPALSGDDFSFEEADAGILSFRRGERFRCIVNFGDRPVPLPPAQMLLAASDTFTDTLPPDAAVWIFE